MKKVASKNNLIKLFLSFYALLQIYFSKIGGVTYDELGYRLIITIFTHQIQMTFN